MYIWIIDAIIIATLIYASIEDIKTKTIPIMIFPLSFAACSVLNIIRIINSPNDWKIELLMLVLGGVLYGLATFFLSKKRCMGEADFYMFLFIGFSLGFASMTEVVIFACAAGIIMFIINKIRKKQIKEYPFAPMMLTGMIVHVILQIILSLVIPS